MNEITSPDSATSLVDQLDILIVPQAESAQLDAERGTGASATVTVTVTWTWTWSY